MSVQSDEMKRSTLQRKDREELTSIATALGGKPSSRARKAELVDLILELADAGEPESEEAASDDAPAADSAVADVDTDTDDTPNEPSEPDLSSSSTDKTPTGTGSDDRDQSDGSQQDQGNRRRRRRGRDRDKQGSDDAWSGEPSPVEGFLDLRDEGYGFLRVNGFMPSKEDAYVSEIGRAHV